MAISLFVSTVPPLTVGATKVNKTHKNPQPQVVEAPSRAGELLVSFRPGVGPQQKELILNSHGVRIKRRLRGGSDIERLELRGGQSPQAAALQLMLEPQVEFAEPNFLIRHDQFGSPDDPEFGNQWSLRNIGQSGGQFGADINVSAAWQTTTGSTSVPIAVIDSGIDFTHPDLVNNRWHNAAEQANGVDDNGDDYVDD
jgi:subtilisin family serine protease